MAIANVVSAFGLAGAAGLNAYIPLLIVAVLSKLGVIQLGEQFSVLSSWPAIGALVVLLVIEIVVDKVPGADHVNDAVQTFVRPAAGAVLFAANTGVIAGMDQTVALVAGLILALSVHATKAAARPVVNGATMGIGAPFISTAEDILSAITSVIAVFAWPLVIVLAIAFGWVVYKIISRVRRLRNLRDDGSSATIIVQ